MGRLLGQLWIAKWGDSQDMCDLMLGKYINIELANPLTKCTLLVIGQICLMLQEIRFQVQVLKACKPVQETSEEVLDFKTRQLVSIEI